MTATDARAEAPAGATGPVPAVAPPLTVLGAPGASCEGDSCSF
ncbi:hypothetical protein [Herbiconiux sp. VKM Ac-2851]|nr:hypothetical protein [Herbiconiux sp. VKM Ac-2851]